MSDEEQLLRAQKIVLVCCLLSAVTRIHKVKVAVVMKLQKFKNQSWKINARDAPGCCAVVLGLYELYQTGVVHKVMSVAGNHYRESVLASGFFS